MKASSSRIASNWFESRRIEPSLVKFNHIKLNKSNLDREEPNQIDCAVKKKVAAYQKKKLTDPLHLGSSEFSLQLLYAKVSPPNNLLSFQKDKKHANNEKSVLAN